MLNYFQMESIQDDKMGIMRPDRNHKGDNMKEKRVVFQLCRYLMLLFPFLLMACQAGQKTRPTCELVTIARVETALNDPRGFEGQFTQIWPNGGRSEGRLVYLPGRIRLNYTLPSEMIMVAKGTKMVAKKFDDHSITHIGLARNPLGLLLKNPVHLSNPILVTAIQHGTQALQISLASADNPSQGLLTLRFRDVGGQLTLIQMQAVDARNQRTVVDLSQVYPGVQVGDAYFTYPDHL